MAIARIYIVRHGETEENRTGIIQGHLDTQLNADGVEQSHRAAEALQAVPFTAGFASDLERASKTAEIILTYHPNVKLHKQTELRERDMGELQGQVYSARLMAAGLSYAESAEDMSARAVSWWNDTILKHVSSLPVAPDSDSPSNILVVSHGGFIGILVRGLIGSGKITRAEGVHVGKCLNTAVAIIDMQEDGLGQLVQYGNIAHLLTKKMDVVEGNVDEQGLGASRM